MASGMQTHPKALHLGLLEMYLRISAIRAAEPPVTFASGKEIGLSGEVTVMSKAAGLPVDQLGTR